MKQQIVIITLVLGFVTSSLKAQIQIQPDDVQELQEGDFDITAGINSTSNRPYWIGVSSYPHLYLGSGTHHKVGIGVGLPQHGYPGAPQHFDVHAKLHVRHDGGTGSDSPTVKGPHLLLDETNPSENAILRFRQSENISNLYNGSDISPGRSWWDLRGYANGSSLGQDEFRLINKDASEDLFNISGDGNFKFTGESITHFELKAHPGNNPIKLEFGEVGTVSNGGRLWYNNSNGVMQVFAGGAASLVLDAGNVGVGSVNPGDSKLYVDGYSTLGDHAQAPKIKTWYGEAYLPNSSNGVTNHSILPVDGGRILSCSVMVTNDKGEVVPPNLDLEIEDSYYYYKIDGTTISLFTTAYNFSWAVQGNLARIFITYTD
ncbi:hypothetical protein [Jiulongibacter sediminis]|uniref:Uncharacterized protein n=1 Tax=Jiulongibacter sediminis TaxID=1605367 RepID=A0A0P7BB39_9BACT|nr:hypothetical protein [Jiulongibacter sediminis]KPM47680.1 hypothetical protein AFM12_14515 [Jiulongibacter sediminis]TBX23473.1 hypothetical protein TK44_14525 [Jiulongibacter sediminis]